MLIAKSNQPTMRQDLELFFEDPDADQSAWQRATFVDKGHGCLENWFAKEWGRIEQVFRVQRWVTKKGHTSYEVVYGISSLTPQQADAHQLGELVRAHWADAFAHFFSLYLHY